MKLRPVTFDDGNKGVSFILVNETGEIIWIKDYGAPDNPNRTMYVEVEELVGYIKSNLGK